MSVTPAICDYLMKSKFEDVYALMQRSKTPNLSTMNSSIYALFKYGLITKETALDYSDNKIEMEQMLRGIYHGAKNSSEGNLI